ncbi:MAG TPA: GNAT family N-acetyltransferase [Acidimicrobiia bacterium]
MIAATRFPVAVARTRRGETFKVRPVHPDDKWTLANAFTRLSPETRYNRFLVPSERLSNSQLAYLTELDFHDHVAWGVIDGDDPIAIGRFIRLDDDPTSADFAITVFDTHQGRGIGPMLMEILAVSARSRGIRRFHFDVLAENGPMLSLLRRYGADIQPDDDLVHAVLDVQKISAPEVVEGDLGALIEAASREH